MRNTCAAVGTVVVHARHAMRAQHHPHLLQHVAVVVDAGFVEPDRGVDALRLEHVQRRDAGAQAEIGRAVVADAGAGFRQPIDVRLRSARRRGPASSAARAGRSGRCTPPPCSRRAGVRIPSGTPSPPDACASAHRICATVSAKPRQRRVGAPMQIGRRQLHLDPALVVMPRRAGPRTPRRSRRARAETGRTSAAPARAARPAGWRRSPRRPGTPAGSGRAPRTSRTRASRHPGRRAGSPRSRASTSGSLPGAQPCRCCTVVMPEAIISNAEYSVSRYGLTLRITMRVTNHSSSGMSGEPSCTGVRPTW